MSRRHGDRPLEGYNPNAPSPFEVYDDAPEVIEDPRKDTSFDEPSIHANHTVITVQPRNLERATDKPSRRPIPVNTSDWVSTPRSQLSPLLGTDFLIGIEQLEVQRIVELSTLLGESQSGNRYKVKVPRAETIFLATETSGAYQRATILGSCREFNLSLTDPTGEVALTLRKAFGWGCVPGMLHKMTVECADFIGSVEQKFTLLGPRFVVYDAQRNPLCGIYGPNLCSCCMSREAQFQIVSNDGTHQIATLLHHWDHLLLDYTLILTVPADTNVTLKALLLGAMFLVEYLFFE